MNSIEKFCREIGMPGNNTGDGSLCAMLCVNTENRPLCYVIAHQINTPFSLLGNKSGKFKKVVCKRLKRACRTGDGVLCVEKASQALREGDHRTAVEGYILAFYEPNPPVTALP